MVPRELIDAATPSPSPRAFHAEHNRLYGYSLEQENTPIEIINVRVQAIGVTDKPTYREEAWAGADAAPAPQGPAQRVHPGDQDASAKSRSTTATRCATATASTARP